MYAIEKKKKKNTLTLSNLGCVLTLLVHLLHEARLMEYGVLC
jgi:hypothetical protein